MTKKKYEYFPGCQRLDCRYRQKYDGSCEYYVIEGHTRTALHQGENVDINNPCREYKPGEIRGRQAMRVKI